MDASPVVGVYRVDNLENGFHKSPLQNLGLGSSPAANDQTQAEDNEDDGPVHPQVEIDRIANKQAH